jgi:hypothetical protein
MISIIFKLYLLLHVTMRTGNNFINLLTENHTTHVEWEINKVIIISGGWLEIS